jgi:hypothetical protein
VRIAPAVALVVALTTLGAVGSSAAAGRDARGGEPGLTVTHVRCLSRDARALLDMALERSPSIRSLAERLERSDVVVYLQLPGDTNPQAAVAQLTFVTFAAATRYVLVQVDPWRTVPLERLALLGHELHHALEIAQEPGVRDTMTLRALYRRIGHEHGRGQFETEPARITGRRVQAELSGPR